MLDMLDLCQRSVGYVGYVHPGSGAWALGLTLNPQPSTLNLSLKRRAHDGMRASNSDLRMHVSRIPNPES
jgi:hypothetical protein